MLIALTGHPGSGKSTAANLLINSFEEKNLRVTKCSIGFPLYNMQNEIYSHVGIGFEYGKQDGVLLNFLGSHCRKIRPRFLIDDFIRRCKYLSLLGYDIIICDDARPIDLPELKKLGFFIFEIRTQEKIRKLRKKFRKDLIEGDDNHITEKGVKEGYIDAIVYNEGSINDLNVYLIELVVRINEQSFKYKTKINWINNRDHTLKQFVFEVSSYIRKLYKVERHQIGTGMICHNGAVIYGVHIEAGVGRASTCAENMALGKIIESNTYKPKLMTSVRYPKPNEGGNPRLVPPCGLCRELLLDYYPDLQVLLEEDNRYKIKKLSSLLPVKYKPSKWVDQKNSNLCRHNEKRF